MPRTQFKLSVNCLTGLLRREGPSWRCGIDARRIDAEADAALVLKLFGANLREEQHVPPVKPKRASLTRLLLMVQRHAVVFEKRFESWLPKFGNPGNTGSTPLSQPRR